MIPKCGPCVRMPDEIRCMCSVADSLFRYWRKLFYRGGSFCWPCAPLWVLRPSLGRGGDWECARVFRIGCGSVDLGGGMRVTPARKGDVSRKAKNVTRGKCAGV